MDSDDSFTQYSRRSSAFTEIGLEGFDSIVDEKIRVERPRLAVRFRSNVSIVEPTTIESEPATPAVATAVTPKSFLSRLPIAQLALLIAVIAISLPTFNGASGSSNLTPAVAEAVPMAPKVRTFETLPAKRQDSTTDVCKRWAGQSAVVNGTVYYYGGRATTSADQTNNEWSRSIIMPDQYCANQDR